MSIRTLIANWLFKGQSYDYGNPNTPSNPNRNIKISSYGSVPANPLGDRMISMRFYGATGGKVVEVFTQDSSNVKEDRSLHIITDDKDLGQEIAKIITLTSLRM